MRKTKKKKKGGRTVVTVLLVLMILAAASAFLWISYRLSIPTEPAVAVTQTAPQTEVPETAETTGAVETAGTVGTTQATEDAQETTIPAVPVVTADGNPASIRCRESYLSETADPSAVVATMGSEALTNGELQVLYLTAVNAYRQANNDIAPDFSQPLDTQLCPLGSGDLSWQHYFLQQAVRSWQIRQTILDAAAQPQIITEEAYKPDQTDTLHAKYIAPELPVNDFLYADRECYTPNALHQAYLDGLEDALEELAVQKGYGSLDAYAQAVFGSDVSAEMLVDMATDYNLSYMYFTEKSYDVEVTEEEIATYLADSPLSGENLVDFRHILMIPEGAEVAEDGTVTATESQWSACLRMAEYQMNVWKAQDLTKTNPDASFAQLASEQSADEGSRLDGGLYSHIRQGQLTEVLDAWCFDESRKAGDSELLQSEYGIHIVYLKDIIPVEEANALEALTLEKEIDFWREAMLPIQADYSKAALWTEAGDFSLQDALYPDVGHQRFPKAIVYLQQDYMYSPFGYVQIGKNGCGITAFAMLATYMTDSIQTPHMVAQQFSKFQVGTSTDGSIFSKAPAELGFYTDRTVFDIDQVIEALRSGQVVISLQVKGIFTSSGHYLLVQAYNEEDDTFEVRDSNIYNYGKLPGHKTDRFSRAALLSGGGQFYIMQPKIVRIPGCTRCGGTFDDHGPEGLIGGYVCEKCTAALSRRENFLKLPGLF